MSIRRYRLTLSFESLGEMLAFADGVLPEDTAVYIADSLDTEYGGRAPARSFVVRSVGAKPDAFRADRYTLGGVRERAKG